MKIIYSFNKKGFEAGYWEREISVASNTRYQFVPFNHQQYLDPFLYRRAQLLDNLYFDKHLGLRRMYVELTELIRNENADALIVDNCFPYHPEFLRKLNIYKVLRTSDGPMGAYDRDFAYLHAYDHVLYHTPAYSGDIGIEEKLRYLGVRRADFWPFGLFDAMHDPTKTEAELFNHERSIAAVYIGMPYRGKLPTLANLQRALGSQLKVIGFPLKWSIYYKTKYRFPGFTARPIASCEKYVSYYQQTKIGINIHNRGKYTVGNYRMFELPGNGVMQISDGGEYLDTFFKVGDEIESYDSDNELIDKVRHYLANDRDRVRIARAGFRRVKDSYPIANLLQQCGQLIENGMTSSKARIVGTGDYRTARSWPCLPQNNSALNLS